MEWKPFKCTLDKKYTIDPKNTAAANIERKIKMAKIKNKKSTSSIQNLNSSCFWVTLYKVKVALDLAVNFTSRINFSNHIAITIAKAKKRPLALKKSYGSKNASTLFLSIKPMSALFLNNVHKFAVRRTLKKSEA